MSTFDYFLITLPFFLLYLSWSLGKSFTKEICSILQSVVCNREYHSSRLCLKTKDENNLLNIIRRQTNDSLTKIVKYPVEFIPQKTRFWYVAGAATILCRFQKPSDGQRMCVLLKVQYKQQISAKPWLITAITEITM